jgi:hypothetical protein
MVQRIRETPVLNSVKDSVQIHPDMGQYEEQLIISWSLFVCTIGSTSITIVYICEGRQYQRENNNKKNEA